MYLYGSVTTRLYNISFSYWLMSVPKGTNNKWTYDLVVHLMVDLNTIIVLAFKAYMANLNDCELHPGDDSFSFSFKRHYWWMLGFCIIYMLKADFSSKLYLFTYVDEYIWTLISFILTLFLYILPFAFLSLKCTCIAQFYKNKLIYKGLCSTCCKCTWLMIWMKVAPPDVLCKE